MANAQACAGAAVGNPLGQEAAPWHDWVALLVPAAIGTKFVWLCQGFPVMLHAFRKYAASTVCQGLNLAACGKLRRSIRGVALGGGVGQKTGKGGLIALMLLAGCLHARVQRSVVWAQV